MGIFLPNWSRFSITDTTSVTQSQCRLQGLWSIEHIYPSLGGRFQLSDPNAMCLTTKEVLSLGDCVAFLGICAGMTKQYLYMVIIIPRSSEDDRPMKFYSGIVFLSCQVQHHQFSFPPFKFTSPSQCANGSTDGCPVLTM